MKWRDARLADQTGCALIMKSNPRTRLGRHRRHHPSRPAPDQGISAPEKLCLQLLVIEISSILYRIRLRRCEVVRGGVLMAPPPSRTVSPRVEHCTSSQRCFPVSAARPAYRGMPADESATPRTRRAEEGGGAKQMVLAPMALLAHALETLADLGLLRRTEGVTWLRDLGVLRGTCNQLR